MFAVVEENTKIKMSKECISGTKTKLDFNGYWNMYHFSAGGKKNKAI